ncbi:MAG: SidA/IucD/PvdA family monooxygenase [Thiotrichaceae bacterium]
MSDVYKMEVMLDESDPIKGKVLDCVGIGFGPANIALAISLEERGILDNTLFLEQSTYTDWNPEMLILGSDIQHNPLRDFVTPRDPTSKYGFLSYLKSKGRLFQFLNLDAPFPPRVEYAEYVKWVANQFSRHVRYLSTVTSIQTQGSGANTVYKVNSSDGRHLLSKTISYATGRSPNIPQIYRQYLGSRVVHLTQYKSALEKWTTDSFINSIVVIGASQSAAEIILDLNSKFPERKITCISRSFGFKLKDTSPFTEAIYEPEFVDYYFNATDRNQKAMRSELLHSNYSAADHDVICSLQMRLYEQSVVNGNNLCLLNNKQVTNVVKRDNAGYRISLIDKHDNSSDTIEADAIVLATGFLNAGSNDDEETCPKLLRSISENCEKRKDGSLSLARYYSLIKKDKNQAIEVSGIHLNGVCESTHGFGDAGSFSLLSIRSGHIAQSIESKLRITPDISQGYIATPSQSPIAMEVPHDRL